MNVSRRCADGQVREEEILNQSQLYITTAGYKNTFSQNTQELLVATLIEKLGEPRLLGCEGYTFANSEGLKRLTLCQAA